MLLLWSHKWFKTLIVSLVLLACIFWLPTPVQRPFRIVTGLIAQPFEQIFSFAGFKLRDMFSTVTSIRDFKRENAQLLAENLRLEAENASLRDFRRENSALREEFGAPRRDDIEIVVADIIGWNAEESGRWIVVNRGSADGISYGMPVVSGGGVLLGRIEDTSLTSAKAMLLTHPGSVISMVDETTEARGVLRGEYGLGMVFDMVPQTDEIQAGDRVVTSGLGGDLPRGLVVGTLGEVRQAPDRLFQQASVKPLVSIESLRFVGIVREF